VIGAEADLARLLGSLANAIRQTSDQIIAADTGEHVGFVHAWEYFVALWNKKLHAPHGISMTELEGFARRYTELRVEAASRGFALSTPIVVSGCDDPAWIGIAPHGVPPVVQRFAPHGFGHPDQVTDYRTLALD
jgi:hypothetical protein